MSGTQEPPGFADHNTNLAAYYSGCSALYCNCTIDSDWSYRKKAGRARTLKITTPYQRSCDCLRCYSGPDRKSKNNGASDSTYNKNLCDAQYQECWFELAQATYPEDDPMVRARGFILEDTSFVVPSMSVLVYRHISDKYHSAVENNNGENGKAQILPNLEVPFCKKVHPLQNASTDFPHPILIDPSPGEAFRWHRYLEHEIAMQKALKQTSLCWKPVAKKAPPSSESAGSENSSIVDTTSVTDNTDDDTRANNRELSSDVDIRLHLIDRIFPKSMLLAFVSETRARRGYQLKAGDVGGGEECLIGTFVYYPCFCCYNKTNIEKFDPSHYDGHSDVRSVDSMTPKEAKAFSFARNNQLLDTCHIGLLCLSEEHARPLPKHNDSTTNWVNPNPPLDELIYFYVNDSGKFFRATRDMIEVLLVAPIRRALVDLALPPLSAKTANELYETTLQDTAPDDSFAKFSVLQQQYEMLREKAGFGRIVYRVENGCSVQIPLLPFWFSKTGKYEWLSYLGNFRQTFKSFWGDTQDQFGAGLACDVQQLCACFSTPPVADVSTTLASLSEIPTSSTPLDIDLDNSHFDDMSQSNSTESSESSWCLISCKLDKKCYRVAASRDALNTCAIAAKQLVADKLAKATNIVFNLKLKMQQSNDPAISAKYEDLSKHIPAFEKRMNLYNQDLVGTFILLSKPKDCDPNHFTITVNSESVDVKVVDSTETVSSDSASVSVSHENAHSSSASTKHGGATESSSNWKVDAKPLMGSFVLEKSTTDDTSGSLKKKKSKSELSTDSDAQPLSQSSSATPSKKKEPPTPEEIAEKKDLLERKKHAARLLHLEETVSLQSKLYKKWLAKRGENHKQTKKASACFEEAVKALEEFQKTGKFVDSFIDDEDAEVVDEIDGVEEDSDEEEDYEDDEEESESGEDEPSDAESLGSEDEDELAYSDDQEDSEEAVSGDSDSESETSDGGDEDRIEPMSDDEEERRPRLSKRKRRTIAAEEESVKRIRPTENVQEKKKKTKKVETKSGVSDTESSAPIVAPSRSADVLASSPKVVKCRIDVEKKDDVSFDIYEDIMDQTGSKKSTAKEDSGSCNNAAQAQAATSSNASDLDFDELDVEPEPMEIDTSVSEISRMPHATAGTSSLTTGKSASTGKGKSKSEENGSNSGASSQSDQHKGHDDGSETPASAARKPVNKKCQWTAEQLRLVDCTPEEFMAMDRAKKTSITKRLNKMVASEKPDTATEDSSESTDFSLPSAAKGKKPSSSKPKEKDVDEKKEKKDKSAKKDKKHKHDKDRGHSQSGTSSSGKQGLFSGTEGMTPAQVNELETNFKAWVINFEARMVNLLKKKFAKENEETKSKSFHECRECFALPAELNGPMNRGRVMVGYNLIKTMLNTEGWDVDPSFNNFTGDPMKVEAVLDYLKVVYYMDEPNIPKDFSPYTRQAILNARYSRDLELAAAKKKAAAAKKAQEQFDDDVDF